MRGGTEELALRLASLLDTAGHHVSFKGGGWTGENDGVRFLADDEAPEDCDVLVCVQADPPAINAGRSIFWSHAAQHPRSAGWDAVVAVSPYHAKLLRNRLAEVEVIHISPGVDMPRARDPAPHDRFIYSSSPDRGLHRLLAVWPALWQRFQIPLSLTYDLRAVLSRHGGHPSLLGERLRLVARLLDQPGVVVHGELDRGQLEDLYGRSAALLYPLDPVILHSELLSLSVLGACAAGLPPLLAPVDCFPSEYGEVAFMVGGSTPAYDAEAWVAAVGKVLVEREGWSERVRQFAAHRTWDAFSSRWSELIEGIQRRPARREEPPDRGVWLLVEAQLAPGEDAVATWIAQAAEERGHRVVRLSMHDESSTDRVTRAVGTGFDRIVLVGTPPADVVLGLWRQCAPSTPITQVKGLLPTRPSTDRDLEVVDLLVVGLPEEALEVGTAGSPPLIGLPALLRERVRCVGPLPGLLCTSEPKLRSEILFVTLGDGDDSREVLALAAAELDISFREIDVTELPGALPGARLVVTFVRPDTIGLALAASVPLLLVAPGTVFGGRAGGTPERAPDRDRIAQVLVQAGLADIVHRDLAPSVLARAIEAALFAIPPQAGGGGAVRAVSLVEGLERRPPVQTWRPPELRP